MRKYHITDVTMSLLIFSTLIYFYKFNMKKSGYLKRIEIQKSVDGYVTKYNTTSIH